MLNPKLKSRGLPKNAKKDIPKLAEDVLSGNISALSRAITLAESSRNEDRQLRSDLIKRLFPHSGKSYRLGITGVPGVGKSTFIEAFGLAAIQSGYKPAVLSIDPSSSRSGGSILGDKTRMNELSLHPKAYVRPSASGLHLGGVARSTRESIMLCEAAGYDLIIVETVGVGQSEIEALQLTDFFLLLMLAGAGDELQGIKRGIMETADAILITKADGDNIALANNAAQEYRRALHLMPPHEGNWIPKVATSSSLNKLGMDKALQWMKQYHTLCTENGYWLEKRSRQALYWFEQNIQSQTLQLLRANPEFKQMMDTTRTQVEALKTDPFQAVDEVVSRIAFEIKK
ncbi:MAG: methylmalonyl Co-A mutase-associated GTPase MeaB [Cryomorphaceae bacterium]|nr:methylmalonyl Co-A mutase-associated GTPase MeaB [Cryomorphaceae bacterium]